MSVSFRIRPAAPRDGTFLADMVVEAANWGPAGARPRYEVMSDPLYSRYLVGWQRPGDAGFVAEDQFGDPIGAAWYRILPRDDAGHGYVDRSVPELIIGVRPIWRAHGVGRALLRALTAKAREEGYARVSLSVQRGNFAVTLYRSEGFAVVRAGHGRDVMVKRLN